MKAFGKLWCTLATAALVSGPAQAELSEEFLAAQPRVQLYMAYAEFKMAHYAAAREMWENMDGPANAEAHFNLGILYEQGMGTERNLNKARDHYLSAARAGSRSGAYQLGLMHQYAPELVDEDMAREWLSIAAADGDGDAQALLKSIAESAQPGPMQAIQIALASGKIDQAIDRLQQLASAEPPFIPAVTQLAWLYESGLSVERDIDRAAELFEIAANAGDPKAQYALAVMYATGVGKKRDEERSAQWLQASASQNYQPALSKLGSDT